jgi:hypothetical protein
MQKFTVTTKQDAEKSEPLEHEFGSEKAATYQAQVALAEMAQDALPDGSHVELGAKVENQAGDIVYKASLVFNAQTGDDVEAEEKQADDAAEDVAAALRGGSRE